ncbi:Hypothetical predicted protein [Podarcis lilfordi]|uniref:Uncharacterized protein n=1 Tax=Podarcis lilfordi TaxID=74358 RepID=A0AA35L2A6_9SAUR|nr:Hypothetical predicted protein [Podarcis lilfordi]
MLTPREEEFYGTLPPKDPDLSSWTYEIIMLCLSGSIFLAALMFVAVKTIRTRVLHFQRRGKPSSPAKELSAAETVVVNIIVKRNEAKDIFTAQVTGPAYIIYMSETEMPLEA